MAQYDPIVIKAGVPSGIGADALRADNEALSGLTTTSLASGDVCQVTANLTLSKASYTSLNPIVGVYDGVSGSVVRSGVVVATFIGGLTLLDGDTVYLSLEGGKLTNLKPTLGALHEVGVVVSASSSKILLQPKRAIQLPASLLVHWTLDEPTLPFLNTGILGASADLDNIHNSGPITYDEPGKIGRAIRFHGGGSAYIYSDDGSCEPQLGVDGCTGLTVACWWWLDSYRDWSAAWTKWTRPSFWTNYWYSAVCQVNSGGGGWVGLKLAGMTESDWYTSSLGTLPLGQWNHVVLTYDGEDLIAYLNGTPVTTTPRNPIWGPNINWFSSGRWGVGASGYPETVDGLVDDVKIANYAWSAAYVAAQAAI